MRTVYLCLILAWAASAADIKDLSFMTGCWASGGVEEVWLKPAGGTMLGMSRAVKGDRTVSSEFLHISAAQDGAVILTAQPKSAPKATQFRLIELKDGSATFSNPNHDYPQRIIYRRETEGSLSARIEGTAGGKQRHTDFKYQRVSCGP